MLRHQPVRKVNRRGRSGSTRKHVLDVRIRTSTARRRRQETVSKWVITLLLVVTARGGRALRRARGPRPVLLQQSRITRCIASRFDLDNILTREEALAATGLQEGINIFSVDLSKIETAFSGHAPGAGCPHQTGAARSSGHQRHALASRSRGWRRKGNPVIPLPQRSRSWPMPRVSHAPAPHSSGVLSSTRYLWGEERQHPRRRVAFPAKTCGRP